MEDGWLESSHKEMGLSLIYEEDFESEMSRRGKQKGKADERKQTGDTDLFAVAVGGGVQIQKLHLWNTNDTGLGERDQVSFQNPTQPVP